jgi:hypothetical protein
MALTLVSALTSGLETACAEPQPSAAMMVPIHQLAAFMSTLKTGQHPTMFAAVGVCIIENFAPFMFCGPHAVADWEAGFRAHAHDLSGLAATFGEAHDFAQNGDRVYVSLPTRWTGLNQGRSFDEHGAWAFVLERSRAPAGETSSWRIVGYGWGVTSYSEAAQ